MLFLASDHAGFERKEVVKKYLKNQKIKFEDLGTNDTKSVDFPIFAKKLCKKVLEDKQNKGILICGSGIGMSICANRFKGIRAALCTTPEIAKLCREHNDANVLVLQGRFGTDTNAKKMIKNFLTTKHLGGKYQRRMEMIDE